MEKVTIASRTGVVVEALEELQEVAREDLIEETVHASGVQIYQPS